MHRKGKEPDATGNSVYEELMKAGVPPAAAAKFIRVQDDFTPAARSWKQAFMRQFREAFYDIPAAGEFIPETDY
jgi:hypothetical protein